MEEDNTAEKNLIFVEALAAYETFEWYLRKFDRTANDERHLTALSVTIGIAHARRAKQTKIFATVGVRAAEFQ